MHIIVNWPAHVLMAIHERLVPMSLIAYMRKFK